MKTRTATGKENTKRRTSRNPTRHARSKTSAPAEEAKVESAEVVTSDTKTKAKGKIIFLDVDGVLNCMPEDCKKVWPDFIGGTDERAFGLNPQIVVHLKNLLDRTDAKIVVSSSWRHFEDYEPFAHDECWRHVLARRVCRNPDELFIGSTPTCSTAYMIINGVSEYAVRGKEIKEWMNTNESKVGKPNVDYSFCIIDDEVTDILRVFKSKYVVHTNYRVGLTPEDVERAYHILNFA